MRRRQERGLERIVRAEGDDCAGERREERLGGALVGDACNMHVSARRGHGERRARRADGHHVIGRLEDLTGVGERLAPPPHGAGLVGVEGTARDLDGGAGELVVERAREGRGARGVPATSATRGLRQPR